MWSVQTEGNCPGRNSSVRSGIRFSLFDSLLQLIAPEQRVRIGEFRPGHPEPVVRRFHLKCLVEATSFESLSAQQKSMVKRQLEKVIKLHIAFVFILTHRIDVKVSSFRRNASLRQFVPTRHRLRAPFPSQPLLVSNTRFRN